MPCYLAVLKDLGRANGAPLSFPIEGWTLTLDIPRAAPGLDPMLECFDRVVAEAGGRVYLSKDARLRPETVRAMYPRLDEWRAARDRAAPRAGLVLGSRSPSGSAVSDARLAGGNRRDRTRDSAACAAPYLREAAAVKYDVLLVDLGIAILAAVIVLTITPGLAVASMIAIAVLIACAISLRRESRRQHRARPRQRASRDARRDR